MNKIFLLLTFYLGLCISLYGFSQNSNGQSPSKITAKEPSNIFRIEIQRSTYYDEAVVAFFSAALDAYDPYDSEKMFSPDNNYPQTYTLTTNNAIVAINGESLLSSGIDRIIPLGFHTDIVDYTNGFVFTATNLAGFDATINVYLEDLQQNVMQNLRMDNTYNFSSGIVDNATRFRLHFITPTSTKLVSWTGGSSTDWAVAGNWSTGNVPAADDHVYISSVPTNQPLVTSIFSSPAECSDLNIYSGASLTIDATKALTVNGNFSNQGSFTIKSNASGTGSFLCNGTISGTGTFAVEKYLSDSRWWYVGSPMSSETSDAFGTLSSSSGTGIRLLEWDETTATYADLTSGTELLTPLQGYTYKNFNDLFPGPQTAMFSGTLNNGPLSDNTLSRTGTGTFAGFNLVCNPYPSAIDIEVFGPLTNNLETTVWFRSGSIYPTYNWTSNIGSPVTTTQYIPAMQAFWVNVTTHPGTISLDNTARLHSSQAFYKNELATHIFRLEASRDSLIDETVIGFFSAATDAFDAYDSQKMFSPDQEYPQIYTLTTDSEIVVINGLTEFSAGESRTVPLGFVAYVTDSFTFRATNLDEFDASIPVFLEDMITGAMQDLRNNNTYTFYSTPVNNADRFRLHFGDVATGISDHAEFFVNVYSFDNTVYVYTSEPNCLLEIYDLPGKLVFSGGLSEGMNAIKTVGHNSIYIAKISNGNSIVSKKIIMGK